MSITIDGTTGISGNNGSASTPAIQGEDTNTGIFFPAADTVAVATAGTERLRVDSAGRLGVGTTSPGDTLDINGGIFTTPTSTDNTGTANISMQSNRSSSTQPRGSLSVIGSSSAVNYQALKPGYLTVYSAYADIALNADTSKTIQFWTGGLERARITAGGDFQFNSGFGSVATAFACRAWVNFNGSNGAIRASGNVSSVTYNGIGQSTVNFTTAMPDTNYSVVCSAHSAGFVRQSIAMPSYLGYATGSIVILYGNTVNAAADNLSHVNVAVFR